jgi:hypothetical protein
MLQIPAWPGRVGHEAWRPSGSIPLKADDAGTESFPCNFGKPAEGTAMLIAGADEVEETDCCKETLSLVDTAANRDPVGAAALVVG